MVFCTRVINSGESDLWTENSNDYTGNWTNQSNKKAPIDADIHQQP